jgi:filamentous hemagglutinin family protein
MLSGVSIAAPPTPNQLPVGGAVAAGSATINTAGSTMNINQTSNRVAINWNSFDIGSNATVNFVQPSASAVALNRVNSANPSQIYGNLNTNGQVFLMNSAGIYFAPGANVNVGGIVATTHQMGDADFMNGSSTFSRNGSTGSVINDGTIKSGIGGYIALLAPEVQNNGVLVAQQGTVALAGGEAITLNFGDLAKLSSLTIAPSLIKTLVENKLAIQAPDGLIILSARAVNQLTGSVINSGSIQADGITQSGGRIILEASSSITHSGNMSVNAAPTSNGNGGTISIIADLSNLSSTTSINGSVSAKAGNLGGAGGNVETSASKVSIGDLTTVNTSAPQGKSGTWTIDPTDYTIAVSGGNITGATLSSNLSTTNVDILSTSGSTGTAGNINVNDVITWSSNFALTLNAQNNININSAITANGANAKLALQYGQGAISTGNLSNYFVNAPINLQSGNNFSTQLGSNGTTINYVVINSLGAAGSVSGSDLQGMNGTLGGNFALGSNLNASVTSSWNSLAGFTPIGSLATPFTGRFDGLGHTISGLTINQPTIPNIGLFGATHGATTIQNVGLLGGTTIGAAGTGGLVGNNDAGLINNSYNTGSVTGAAGTGGLVGSNLSGTLINDYATGNIKGDAGTGGLLGSSTNTTGSVSNSYATGMVDGTASQNLVGIGGAGVGGLVGSMGTGSIDNSYATGNIYGAAGSGGLVGSITGNIRNSYATGNIYGAAGTGGIAGSSSGVVANSYATGNSVGAAGTSSLVGNGTSSYVNAANVSNSIGLGLANGEAPPLIDYSHASNILVITNSISKTYNGLIYSGGYSVNYTMPVGVIALGSISYSGTSQSAINVNSYSIISSGLISSSAYTYTFVNGNLAITKAHLTVTGNDATKTYGDANPVLSSTVSGFVNGQNLAGSGVTGNGAATTTATALTDVGTAAIAAGTGSLAASNYDFTNIVNGNLAITKAHLTVTGNTSSAIYNGTLQTNSFSTSGIKNSNDAVTAVTTLASGTNYSATPYADNLSSATGNGLSNYAITYVNGSLAIGQAPLTVYVNDATKVANRPNPIFTSTVSGFQGSDNLVNSTNNIINYSTAASTSSGVGNYLITATGLIPKINNYIISDIDGTLKITASIGINSPYSQPPSLSSQCTKSFAYDNATPRSTC